MNQVNILRAVLGIAVLLLVIMGIVLYTVPNASISGNNVGILLILILVLLIVSFVISLAVPSVWNPTGPVPVGVPPLAQIRPVGGPDTILVSLDEFQRLRNAVTGYTGATLQDDDVLREARIALGTAVTRGRDCEDRIRTAVVDLHASTGMPRTSVPLNATIADARTRVFDEVKQKETIIAGKDSALAAKDMELLEKERIIRRKDTIIEDAVANIHPDIAGRVSFVNTHGADPAVGRGLSKAAVTAPSFATGLPYLTEEQRKRLLHVEDLESGLERALPLMDFNTAAYIAWDAVYSGIPAVQRGKRRAGDLPHLLTKPPARGGKGGPAVDEHTKSLDAYKADLKAEDERLQNLGS